jgi:ribosomal protein L11 methyltransferase
MTRASSSPRTSTLVPRPWTAVIITASPEVVESLSGFLLDHGAPGLETLEGKGEIFLVAHFRDEPPLAALEGFFDTLAEIFPRAARPLVRVERISEDTWKDGWKDHFPPIEVGTRLFVHPPWVSEIPAGRSGIVIDPGMAFGTGHHESTHGCLVLLERFMNASGARVLDVGTGSGILAIAAAKLGAAEAWATDVDPEARRIATENAIVNEVAGAVRVVDSLDECSGPFDLILVNILARPLIDLAPRLARLLRPGGIVIGAGITADEEHAVAGAWQAAGLVPHAEHRLGEWVSIAYRRGA